MSRDDYDPPPPERATWPGELVVDMLVITLFAIGITRAVVVVLG